MSTIIKLVTMAISKIFVYAMCANYTPKIWVCVRGNVVCAIVYKLNPK